MKTLFVSIFVMGLMGSALAVDTKELLIINSDTTAAVTASGGKCSYVGNGVGDCKSSAYSSNCTNLSERYCNSVCCKWEKSSTAQ